MLIAGLALPTVASAQYGAWKSGRAAGTTYKQAHAKPAFGSVLKTSARGATPIGPGRAYGAHAGLGVQASHGAPISLGFHGYGRAPQPRKIWVAGHWTLREHKVWVAGRTESVWRPARFETRYDACGVAFQVQVRTGHYETIQHPGRWEWRTQRVWVPGGWTLRR